MSKRVIFWHRTDLRLKDNLALQAALDLKPAAFYPVWCWDAHYVYQQLVGPNRWQFLLDSMNDVSESYTKLNKKSRLFVVRGHPTTILPALFKDWKITDIVWETDEDGYATERDAAVAKLAEEAGVKVHAVHGHTLWPMEDIKKASKGKISTAYSSFVSAVSSLSEPARPVDAPKSLPDPGPLDLKGWNRDNHSVDKWRKDDVNDELREGGTTDRDQSYESFAGPKGDFAVPTMEELGYTATSSIRGGESRAHKVLDAFMKNKKQVAEFRKPKTSPAAFNPAETTVLSPHHKFGTLSCREFYWRVRDIEKEFKNHSSPPESLIGQILWREFFHANQWSIPNFTEIRGNKLSRFIPWGLQTRYDKDGNKLHRKEMEKIFEKEEPEQLEHFKAWSEGRTGYPWIDGLMRQLRRDGWIHHLGRHSVACFLTRGGLYISWERGAEVFDRFLVDWDPAVNSGNWMWLSASAFFSQYFRVYSPATYGQKSDKTGALIREYVPELAKLPDKYIYEPWKAPADVLKKAGVTLGDNYPHRIVDDKESKEYCLARMKAAYSAGLHGDDKRVLEGTAAEYVAQFLEGESGKGGTIKADPGSEGEEDSKARGKRKAPVPKGEKDREGEGKKLKQTKLK